MSACAWVSVVRSRSSMWGSYLTCFADYALVKHVFESFERHHKYGQTTAFYGFLWKGKIMIKILFVCIRQWYEWKRRIGFWFCKSGQIVTLGKVHYYSFTTIQQMKKIYMNISYFIAIRHHTGVFFWTNEYCSCSISFLLYHRYNMLLYRYFNKFMTAWEPKCSYSFNAISICSFTYIYFTTQ